jgi:hypothetical protein
MAPLSLIALPMNNFTDMHASGRPLFLPNEGLFAK